MDDKSTPASAPASTSTEQPPVTPVVQTPLPPKKSKTKLIIGIVVGSLVAIGLIALALWYFLVWQNPQNVLTRAVANTFAAEKGIVSGTITTEVNDTKVEVAVKSASDLPKGKVAATIKISPKGIDKTIEVNADGVLGEDGTLYFKIDGVKKAVDIVLDQIVQIQMNSSTENSEATAYMNSPEGKKMVEQMKQEALKQFQPVIDAVDGQWIKVSSSDIAKISSDEATCMFDAVKMIQTDAEVRKEIAKVYQDNAFLTIKGEAEGKNGSKGYDIEIDKTKVKGFISASGDTKVGRKLKDCGGKLTTESMSDHTKDGSLERFRVWISGGELRSIELIQKADDTEVKTAYDLQIGKTESIDVPSDAKSIVDLQKEIIKAMGDSSGESSLLDSFDI